MLQEAKERHERELDAAAASASTAREGAALEAKAGETEEAVQGMESMSIEDGEKEKRDQKRAKAQRKRDKQRAKVRSQPCRRLKARVQQLFNVLSWI